MLCGFGPACERSERARAQNQYSSIEHTHTQQQHHYDERGARVYVVVLDSASHSRMTKERETDQRWCGTEKSLVVSLLFDLHHNKVPSIDNAIHLSIVAFAPQS